jgi:hypothetical protein
MRPQVIWPPIHDGGSIAVKSRRINKAVLAASRNRNSLNFSLSASVRESKTMARNNKNWMMVFR